jgi:hypothetical protein
MSEEILQQIINVISVIAGVAVGAFTTYYANYRLKMHELNYLQKKEINIQIRDCCANFIAESNRLVVHSMHEKISGSKRMIDLTTHYTNIELLCSKEAIGAARNIFDLIISLHSQIEKDVGGNYPDLRKELIKVIKKDIKNRT